MNANLTNVTFKVHLRVHRYNVNMQHDITHATCTILRNNAIFCGHYVTTSCMRYDVIRFDMNVRYVCLIRLM